MSPHEVKRRSVKADRRSHQKTRFPTEPLTRRPKDEPTISCP
jgi:hypothetical protein